MGFPLQVNPLIEAGLESLVVLPGTSKYVLCTESYFDIASRLQPICFLQPRTASEVATTVKALADTNQPFAIRSGGCTVRPGSSNINGGVTIDLSLLKSVTYNSDDTAHIGPGATWDEVYAELEKNNRVAPGGRVAGIGVGGYLLGGGFSFHTARYGLGCDNVVSYQIALADGRVIMASEDDHADIFRVLKGGGNNFGIVTRFTMKTFPSSPVWGGLSFKPADLLPAAAEALVDFTARAAEDPDSTMLMLVANMPQDGGVGVVMLTYNTAGVEKPKIFDRCLSLPEKFSQYQTSKIQDFLPANQLPWPLNKLNVWYTLSFKNDAAIVVHASKKLFDFGEQLQAQTAEFTTHIAFQPLPRLYAEKATAAGGNVLGLDKIPYDAIMLLVSVSVATEQLAEWVRPRVQALVDDVRAFAVAQNGFVPWMYLNYAHDSQDVLQGYGEENVDKIRQAAAKYDPKAVFQRLCTGGFKISAVKD